MVGPPNTVDDTNSRPGFHEELQALINRHSMENGSDTPDFLLANYLNDCLDVWNRHVKARDKWYGHKSLSQQVNEMRAG